MLYQDRCCAGGISNYASLSSPQEPYICGTPLLEANLKVPGVQGVINAKPYCKVKL